MEAVHDSLWNQAGPEPGFARLEGDLEVDVAIVGGGITGLTAAALLSRAGKRVAVLEARRLGAGVTAHTTAHLTEVLDSRYYELAKVFGLEGARLARHSQRAALDTLARIVAERGLDCGFEHVDGWLFSEDEAGADEIGREVEVCRKLGMAVDEPHAFPLPFSVRRAARFADQAQFHPLRYLLPLAAALAREGVRFHEGTRVLEVKGGEPCRLVTGHGQVRARDVLLATHSPITKMALHTRLYPYRSYAVAAPAPRRELRGLFWDTAEPYHYVRAANLDGQTLLLVGGEDHKVGHLEDTWRPSALLERWTRARFEVGELAFRWSAQVFETPDGLPFIGRLRDHVYVATGYAGNGMTSGTLGAMLVSDLVLGRANPWAELYSPARLKARGAARDYVVENLDVAASFVGDRLRRPPETDLARLRPGEGERVVSGGRKLAAWRAADGSLTLLSPVCTHLGCHVRWNEAERSWDCPCHGSRFEAAGEVLDGPAVRGLEAAGAARREERAGERQGPEP